MRPGTSRSSGGDSFRKRSNSVRGIGTAAVLLRRNLGETKVHDDYNASIQPKTISFGDESNHMETNDKPEFSVTGVWVLAMLSLLLSLTLVLLVIRGAIRRRRQRRLWEQLGGRQRQQRNNNNDGSGQIIGDGDASGTTRTKGEESAVLRSRIERRYETIENWMISKRVMEHDEFCNSCIHVLGSVEGNSRRRRTRKCDPSSCPDEEEEEEGEKPSTTTSSMCSAEGGLACPICFEEFQLGDVVSLSPNRECLHVFHHECIKEWLLRNINCPICRKVCIHTDLIRGKHRNYRNKDQMDRQLADFHRNQSQRSATTIICLQQGLLSIPSKVHCTRSELKELKHRISSSVVDRDVLAESRKTDHHVMAASRTDSFSSRSIHNDIHSDPASPPSFSSQSIVEGTSSSNESHPHAFEVEASPQQSSTEGLDVANANSPPYRNEQGQVNAEGGSAISPPKLDTRALGTTNDSSEGDSNYTSAINNA